MKRDLSIANFRIGDQHRPFIIAEMSGNHNKSLERAISLVDAAADAGAHALKLQTYKPDTMTIKQEGGLFTISDTNSLWQGRNLYDLYQEAHTPWEWHAPIFHHARNRGMIAFSTPFDETAVDFLESLSAPVYKIASFENTDWPLLKKVASTGKPVIMSTGISTISDLDGAVRVLRDNGCKDLVLLKCTSTYPASPENSHLNTIPHLSQLFNCHVGLSDHTMGIGAAVASVALGARVIEKHFTLRRTDGGVDSAFSIEPEELEALVVETERAFLAMGKVSYGVQPSEAKSLQFKRSIYAVRNIKKGEKYTVDNVRVIRPGDGLKPMFYDLILGKTADEDIKAGTPLSWTNL